jgi:hypothetical protein
MHQHATSVTPYYVAVARYYQARCACGWSSNTDHATRDGADAACAQHTNAHHSTPVRA